MRSLVLTNADLGFESYSMTSEGIHTEEAVLFGVHSKVARLYGADLAEHEPHATTLNYLVAATVG